MAQAVARTGRPDFRSARIRRDAAAPARRVSHVRRAAHRRRRAALRGQGRRLARSRLELLPEHASRAEGRGAGAPGAAHRGHGRELGDRGAAARIQPHQGAQAALQHRPARRQELSVHPAPCPRVPAAEFLSRRAQSERAVLRSLSERVGGARDAAAAAEAVPAAQLPRLLLQQPHAAVPATSDRPMHPRRAWASSVRRITVATWTPR